MLGRLVWLTYAVIIAPNDYGCRYQASSNRRVVQPVADRHWVKKAAVNPARLILLQRAAEAARGFTYPKVDTNQGPTAKLEHSRVTLFPGQSYNTRVIIRDLTPFLDVAAQRKNLWVYGEISYTDSFGRPRKTAFCYAYSPWLPSGDRFVAHSEHNEAN